MEAIWSRLTILLRTFVCWAMHKQWDSLWYWTSANDRGAEGVWRQYDGTFLSWTPWWSTMPGSQGHPNKGKDANCAEIFLSEDTYAGQWSDEPCSRGYKYICEMDF